MNPVKNNLLFGFGLLSAIWFALTAAAWTYFANLVISLPFGILALFLWRRLKQKEPERKRHQIIPVLLTIGLAFSMIVLVYFLIWE